MNKSEVLLLIDSIMHEFASSYRNEARERVEEKFTSDNSVMQKLRDEYCKRFNPGIADICAINDFVEFVTSA